jgi:AcrR family transcriptional regulator
MRETRVDARVVRTRSQLTAALADLGRNRPVEHISISELCAAAGISRPTFYQHFASVDEVLAAALEDRLAEIIAQAGEQDPARDIPAAISRFLSAMARERRAYQILLSENAVPGGPSETLIAWMVGRLKEHFSLGPEPDLRLTYASAGIVAVMRSWLREPLIGAEGVDELAGRIWVMTMAVLGPESSVPA